MPNVTRLAVFALTVLCPAVAHGASAEHSATNPPAIRISRPVVNGSIDKTLIRRVIRSRNRQLRQCYEVALLRDPTVRGTVGVEFQVERGRVILARIDRDDTDDAPLGDCVLEAMRTLEFPDVKGGGLVTIKYPFAFAPTEDHIKQPRTRAELEQLLPTLGEHLRSRLAAEYLAAGEPERAAALIEDSLSRLKGASSRSAVRRLALFDSSSVRRAFQDDFLAAATRRLHFAGAPAGLAASVVELRLSNHDVDKLVALPSLPLRTLRYAMRRGVDSLSVDELHRLGRAWTATLTPAEVAEVLRGSPVLEALFAAEVADAP